MSDSKTTEDGWTRDFQFHGRSPERVEELAEAYIEGLKEERPDAYRVEVDVYDDWLRVTVHCLERASESDDPPCDRCELPMSTCCCVYEECPECEGAGCFCGCQGDMELASCAGGEWCPVAVACQTCDGNGNVFVRVG